MNNKITNVLTASIVAIVLIFMVNVAEARTTKKKSSKSRSTAIVTVTSTYDTKDVLMSNGTVRQNGKVVGDWVKDNDAYFYITYGDFSEDTDFAVVYDNLYYHISSGDTFVDPNVSGHYIHNYIGENGLKNAVSFDPTTEIITLRTTEDTLYLPLSELKSEEGRVKWH